MDGSSSEDTKGAFIDFVDSSKAMRTTRSGPSSCGRGGKGKDASDKHWVEVAMKGRGRGFFFVGMRREKDWKMS
ncbi:hypothetical protein PVK06_046159 [Gossypium arboreum]|uniref:Uncharacterized protein n=1 Tax=Gossypium arboreum TaxID=29729 RepID=A0ABR0MWI5_GOSAR|nr:hypothetical protein PVK06_046159 [Gossypium arboreum]